MGSEMQDQLDLLAAWSDGVNKLAGRGGLERLGLLEVAMALESLAQVIEDVADVTKFLKGRASDVQRHARQEAPLHPPEWVAELDAALLDVSVGHEVLLAAFHLVSRGCLGVLQVASG
ncbi:hypothetical protein [Actinomadura decatromicini]|uniref:Uncharacterized protein n=1 Tax=Actinomadura decatromicini TaxID=2604572 RepID=A0A5D3FW86_9ACTN|nr:hypothetical protein [Actinomadura decatromicini]TYK52384.1 hypothetical protein FXF68_00905 [Actinomadura decatromicini]